MSGIVALHTKQLPEKQVSHVDPGSCPDCLICYPTPCWWTGKSHTERSECLGDMEELPGSCFQSGQPHHCYLWSELVGGESLSLSLSL